jgi:hypothetical protein
LLEGTADVRIESGIDGIRDDQVVARIEPNVGVVKGLDTCLAFNSAGKWFETYTPLCGLRNLSRSTGYLCLKNI